ncbi:hypothetical protein O3G_MSEX003682 [Manduca sexta]|uniref:HCLS1-associated protein X-1 n=1 Tax=Manduca sexta TaxID=7130 RepID=A0A922CGT2_MANSE|nr:hypothetical protein O3G_MSEX003682 [Manduca sexta]
MNNSAFMDRLRSFLGIRQEPPANDFRNPIWGSDDEDDGDELYTRNEMESFEESMDMHREFTKQMHDMLKSFGNMFGDMRLFFQDDQFENFPGLTDGVAEGSGMNSSSLRDYYLKPGYLGHKVEHPKEDIDLDGKISSHEISGLLKQKESDQNAGPAVPFDGSMVPGRSFCQTIITTSVTKPDGTVETRRIIKNGNEVIEETTTSAPDSRGPGPYNQSMDTFNNAGFIYNQVMSELSTLFKNFY